MITYYTIWLIITLLFQSCKRGIYLNLTILTLVMLSDPVTEAYLDLGYSLYDSVVRFELISFILLTISIVFHKSIKIFLIVLLSFSVNYLYTITDSYEIHKFIYNNYKLFNTILFEMMLAICFVDTRFYLYIDKKILKGK